MDYKRQAHMLRRHYIDNVEGIVFQRLDVICKDCGLAADSIRTLLARAEAAEKERDSLREVLDMYGGEYGITTALKAAEDRAEKAEKERDAAVELIGWIYYEACVSVEHNMRQYLDWLKEKIEQWRKKKEE